MGCFKLFFSLLKPASLIFCTHLLSAHERSHSPLKSHLHLRVPRKTCAVVRICSAQTRSAVCVQIAGALELIGPTLRCCCCWKQRSMHNAQTSLVHASGIQSVTLVVFVFIAAAAKPANSTRVITCCNQQSRLLWSPSTSVCQVQAAAAHTQRRTRHRTSVMLAAATVRAAIRTGAAASH